MQVAAYESDAKRDALVNAAAELVYEQGLRATTLAMVAKRANVPLGNVYYYFKTKESLATAVIEGYVSAIKAQHEAWNLAHDNPRVRLRHMLRSALEEADVIVKFGCAHGSLCQEVEKLGKASALARAGAQLMDTLLAWTEEQLRALGVAGREASDLAVDLIGALQGAALLAQARRSPELLSRQIHRIERRLDQELSFKAR
jgi:AcrR family transcriptional regulator